MADSTFPHTLGAIYAHIQQMFRDSGVEVPELEARFLLNDIAKASWADIIAGEKLQIDNAVRANILDAVKQRVAGKPLSRITNTREFMGLNFLLSTDTLDPRADTETLVYAVIKQYAKKPTPKNILDVGTGSGCILISLLKHFKARGGDVVGVGSDLSQGALDTAIKNAKIHGVDGIASFIKGSYFDAVDTTFDLIVSNPPYIPTQDIPNLDENVRIYDPILALDGGKSGLEAYDAMLKTIKNTLNTGGRAFFEIGYNQHDDFMRLVKKYQIRAEATYPDSQGILRVVEISRGDN